MAPGRAGILPAAKPAMHNDHGSFSTDRHRPIAFGMAERGNSSGGARSPLRRSVQQDGSFRATNLSEHMRIFDQGRFVLVCFYFACLVPPHPASTFGFEL